MDFNFTEEQEMVRDVAISILASGSAALPETPPPPNGDEWFDRKAWKNLGSGNLLGLSLPEEYQGSGLDMVATCLVLEQIGKTLTRVPYLSFGAAAPALERFGSDRLKAEHLTASVEGDQVLTLALVEPRGRTVHDIETTLVADGDGWRLSGEKACVPYASLADLVLVSARVENGETRIVAISPSAPGVSLQAEETTHGQPESTMTLTDVAVAADAVLGAGDEQASVLEFVDQYACLTLSAVQLGVAGQSLAMTAGYTSGRIQFGKPLATFQSVVMRLADCYVAVEAMGNTLWQAAWFLSTGREAAQAVTVAKFWSAEAAQQVSAHSQQLHGGMGVDTDYPLHRFTQWSKYNELSLGSGHVQLARLGKVLATSGAS